MSNAYVGGGHLTVQRDLHELTHLCEVWELEHLAWVDDSVGEYDIVKVHIASINDIPSSGVPHPSDRITDSCKFDELPPDVQREFAEQVANLKTAMDELQ